MNNNIIETMVFTKKEFKEVTDIITGTAKDEARPILQCLHFIGDEVVAIDGYRLMIRKNKNTLEGSYKIHRDYVKIMTKLIKEFKDNIEKISLDFNYNNTVNLNINDEEIYSCDLSEGNYPNHKSLLPYDFKTIVTVYPKEIKDSIKPLRKNKKIVLNIGDNIINIKDLEQVRDTKNSYESKSVIGENMDSNVNVEFMKGEPIEIAFNHTYIKEALKNYSNKEIIDIKLNNKISSVVITDNKNKFDLILPVRLVR